MQLAEQGAGTNGRFRPFDRLDGHGQHVLLALRQRAHRNHSRALGEITAIGDIRDVEIDQVAGPHHVPIGLAAMGAVGIDPDLVAIAGLAATRQLRIGERGINLVVGHAGAGYVVRRLVPISINCDAPRRIACSRGNGCAASCRQSHFHDGTRRREEWRAGVPNKAATCRRPTGRSGLDPDPAFA